MSIGAIVLLAILLVVLVIGLFSLLTNPTEIDEEEAGEIVKGKKRWWRRR